MNLTLRQLRLFEAIARLGQLTRAANEQAISQSAASQALRELETALGYPLFHRVGRELVITDAGRDALTRVEQMLELADSLRDPSGSSMSGSLRIAASVTIASYLLPALVGEFVAQNPGVEPDIRIVNTDDVIRELEQGWAHIGLIEGPATHRQLQVIPWRSDRLVVFCLPDHTLAQAPDIGLAQLATERWILREEGSGTRNVFDTAVQLAGFEPHIALELNRQEAIKQSVRAGLGLGCLSELSVANEVRRGEFKILNTPLQLDRTLSLVCWPAFSTRALTRAAAEYILQH